MKIPQLTIYLKLKAENFEYALISADRPKPTAVFHINQTFIFGKTYIYQL